ncbi:MAG: high-potential iron-sulfur protein [Bdellovibrionia bacterium]
MSSSPSNRPVKSQSMNRRHFLQLSVSGLVASALLPLLGLKAFAAPKAEPLPAGATAVPETDPVATAIGYKSDTKRIDFVKYPNRKKPEAKNQNCKNCALYTSVNQSWGKCQMLTAGLVSAEGWCGSWSKKS